MPALRPTPCGPRQGMPSGHTLPPTKDTMTVLLGRSASLRKVSSLEQFPVVCSAVLHEESYALLFASQA
jgi:hypothetical protein